jgi:hypothetical protein
MSRLAKVPAANWWHSLGDTFDKVCRKYIKRALAAEQVEKGHECGHRFEITVRSSLHVSGGGKHTDADWWSDNDQPVTVRAHNLRDALLVAASLPLNAWFPDDNEDDS